MQALYATVMSSASSRAFLHKPAHTGQALLGLLENHVEFHLYIYKQYTNFQCFYSS